MVYPLFVRTLSGRFCDSNLRAGSSAFCAFEISIGDCCLPLQAAYSGSNSLQCSGPFCPTYSQRVFHCAFEAAGNSVATTNTEKTVIPRVRIFIYYFLILYVACNVSRLSDSLPVGSYHQFVCRQSIGVAMQAQSRHCAPPRAFDSIAVRRNAFCAKRAQAGFLDVEIAEPPPQPFSRNGNRIGELDIGAGTGLKFRPQRRGCIVWIAGLCKIGPVALDRVGQFLIDLIEYHCRQRVSRSECAEHIFHLLTVDGTVGFTTLGSAIEL